MHLPLLYVFLYTTFSNTCTVHFSFLTEDSVPRFSTQSKGLDLLGLFQLYNSYDSSIIHLKSCDEYKLYKTFKIHALQRRVNKNGRLAQALKTIPGCLNASVCLLLNDCIQCSYRNRNQMGHHKDPVLF